MPMSPSFKERLFPIVDQLAEHYGTPFHVYDEPENSQDDV